MFKLLYSTKSENKNSTQQYIPLKYEKSDTTGHVEIKSLIDNKNKNNLDANSSKVASYKEIFKEPKEENLMDKLKNEKELSELDKKSKEIIEKTEKFIKKNNLELPNKPLSKEEQEKFEKLDKKIKNLEKQLEELGNE